MTIFDDNTIPVAMHQWFHSGEAWSYHPNLGNSLSLLQSGIVKEQLDERKTILQRDAGDLPKGVFMETLHGRTLLGIQEYDSNCPDPKAAERCPTKMRVAFLPAPPKREELDSILRQLRTMTAERSGADPNLRLSLDPSKLDQSIQSGPHRLQKGILRPLIIMTIILATIGTLLLSCNLSGFWGSLGAGSQEISDIVREIKDVYGSSDTTPLGKNSENAVINEFFDKFSQKKWLDGKPIASSHPDAKLLERLPKESLCPNSHQSTGMDDPDKGYRREDVLEKLRELVKHLYKAKIDKIDDKSPEELVRMTHRFIVDYYSDPTLYVVHLANSPTFSWDEKQVAGFSAFVRKLSKKEGKGSTPNEFETMLDYLVRHGVEGLTKSDLESRPEIIVRCFVGFHTLSDKAELLKNDRLKRNSPPVLFANKFCDGPIPDGLFADTLPEEEKIKDILENYFSVKRSGLDQAIRDIADKFQYDAGKLKTECVDSLRMSETVKEFVEKHCKMSKVEFNTGDFQEDKYEKDFKSKGILQLTYDKNKAPAYDIKCDIPEKSGLPKLDTFVDRFKPESK